MIYYGALISTIATAGSSYMKKVTSLALVLGHSILLLNSACATVPNIHNPTTFLGPSVRGSLTTPLADNVAYSLLGEAGLRNFRASSTLGFRLNPNHRLKFSVEYLWQEIGYAFFSGDTRQWVNQGAIGGDYQYTLWNVALVPQFDLGAYYSHANNRSLSTTNGSFFNKLGLATSFIDARHLAGSNAGGVSPGVTVHPWVGARFGLALNYDKVNFQKNYSPNENVNGFGGTLRLSQFLTDDIVLGGRASVRQAFNDYRVFLAVTSLPYYGSWSFSLDSGYVAGKKTLPNTFNIGFNVDYYLDYCPDLPNYKGEYKAESLVPVPADDFLISTSDPAVYMPQVLAMADQTVTTS